VVAGRGVEALGGADEARAGLLERLPDLGGGAAETAKGNRPNFAGAAPPEQAEPLYERFCDELRALGVPVATGVFRVAS
jgi:hypothetical protein